MEIERKFLVKELPLLENYEYVNIIQGYISTDPVIRIRQTENSFYLTVKSKGHMIREEFELPITSAQYTTLSAKLDGRLIKKSRYFIPLSQQLTAELDIYNESLYGLITVEVEFQSMKEASSFVPPYWFGEDITHDRRYKNNYLSLHDAPIEK